jgi:hypothetical protein
MRAISRLAASGCAKHARDLAFDTQLDRVLAGQGQGFDVEALPPGVHANTVARPLPRPREQRAIGVPQPCPGAHVPSGERVDPQQPAGRSSDRLVRRPTCSALLADQLCLCSRARRAACRSSRVARRARRSARDQASERTSMSRLLPSGARQHDGRNAAPGRAGDPRPAPSGVSTTSARSRLRRRGSPDDVPHLVERCDVEVRHFGARNDQHVEAAIRPPVPRSASVCADPAVRRLFVRPANRATRRRCSAIFSSSPGQASSRLAASPGRPRASSARPT